MQTQRGIAPGPGLVAPELTARGQGSVCLPCSPPGPPRMVPGRPWPVVRWLAGSPLPLTSVLCYSILHTFWSTSDAPGPAVTQADGPCPWGRGTAILCLAVSFSWAQPRSTSSTCLISFILTTPSEAGTMIMPILRMWNQVRGNLASAACRHRVEERLNPAGSASRTGV